MRNRIYLLVAVFFLAPSSSLAAEPPRWYADSKYFRNHSDSFLLSLPINFDCLGAGAEIVKVGLAVFGVDSIDDKAISAAKSSSATIFIRPIPYIIYKEKDSAEKRSLLKLDHAKERIEDWKYMATCTFSLGDGQELPDYNYVSIQLIFKPQTHRSAVLGALKRQASYFTENRYPYVVSEAVVEKGAIQRMHNLLFYHTRIIKNGLGPEPGKTPSLLDTLSGELVELGKLNRGGEGFRVEHSIDIIGDNTLYDKKVLAIVKEELKSYRGPNNDNNEFWHTIYPPHSGTRASQQTGSKDEQARSVVSWPETWGKGSWKDGCNQLESSEQRIRARCSIGSTITFRADSLGARISLEGPVDLDKQGLKLLKIPAVPGNQKDGPQAPEAPEACQGSARWSIEKIEGNAAQRASQPFEKNGETFYWKNTTFLPNELQIELKQVEPLNPRFLPLTTVPWSLENGPDIIPFESLDVEIELKRDWPDGLVAKMYGTLDSCREGSAGTIVESVPACSYVRLFSIDDKAMGPCRRVKPGGVPRLLPSCDDSRGTAAIVVGLSSAFEKIEIANPMADVIGDLLEESDAIRKFTILTIGGDGAFNKVFDCTQLTNSEWAKKEKIPQSLNKALGMIFEANDLRPDKDLVGIGSNFPNRADFSELLYFVDKAGTAPYPDSIAGVPLRWVVEYERLLGVAVLKSEDCAEWEKLKFKNCVLLDSNSSSRLEAAMLKMLKMENAGKKPLTD